MSTPMSQIKICSGVMLNNTYQHTAWFESPQKQREYFEGKVVKTFSSYSYLRKNWTIKVEASMAQATGWTYLFFKNRDNEKTYFYFITNIQYISDTTVELFLELDVMQTYAFDYTLARSFVEREHQATDVPGDNLLDEGLDLGELVNGNALMVDPGDLCALVLATLNPEETTEETTVTTVDANIDKVFSGLAVYAVHPDNFTAFATKLNQLDRWGKSDGIVAMWMYPLGLVKLADNKAWKASVCQLVSGADKYTVSFETENTHLGTYEPANKKLLTYPYNMLYVTNNSGNIATLHFEKFDDRTKAEFKISGALSPEGVCKCHPLNYRFLGDNHEEGILLGGYPSCAWNQDVYKLWLAQNQNQHALATQNGVLTAAAGIGVGAVSLATGNVTGAVGGAVTAYHGLTQIQGLMAQKKDMSIQPPQSKGSFSSSININNKAQNFLMIQKHVDDYHAKMLDDYFDMYGYRCQRVKIPNTHVREKYTYTKTVGCNVYGNICMDDLMKIKSIFDEGVTFWTSPDLIGTYNKTGNTCLASEV